MLSGFKNLAKKSAEFLSSPSVSLAGASTMIAGLYSTVALSANANELFGPAGQAISNLGVTPELAMGGAVIGGLTAIGSMALSSSFKSVTSGISGAFKSKDDIRGEKGIDKMLSAIEGKDHYSDYDKTVLLAQEFNKMGVTPGLFGGKSDASVTLAGIDKMSDLENSSLLKNAISMSNSIKRSDYKVDHEKYKSNDSSIDLGMA